MREMIMEPNLTFGLFFLLLGILTVIRLVRSDTTRDLFWFCNIAPFVLAISFFVNNIQLAKAMINIGLFPQTITFFTLVYGFVSGKNNSDTKKARTYGGFYIAVELLIHVVLILALILTFSSAPTAESLKYSLIILVFLFVLTIQFTSPRWDINELYSTRMIGGGKMIRLPFHTEFWVVYAFIVAWITFFFQYALYHMVFG